ncbi:hypothetical protein F4804DRAFT_350478 [Jackrogersella minutella]|nr:hypothetical protein F4804DRAFT_350478 [Jackrogersella minutella]
MTSTSQIRETTRCLGLLLLSLFLLPVSVAVVCFCLIARGFSPRRRPGVGFRTKPPKTILVTGVGMAKGLTLARSFYISGHRVIGADLENRYSPCSGRYSRSLSAFYSLPELNENEGTEAYVNTLIDIIKKEDVKLWVSCSRVANAVQDALAKESIEQHTPCKCIQFDVRNTSILHNKDSFMKECKKLALPVPETHEVKSSHDILRILSACTTSTPGREFILKPVGLDDINRGNMTLLPLCSEEETKLYISQLKISDSNPWILQQFIPGGEEYCTHALVVRGEVKCFVACPSTELLMHYKLLSRDSSLWRAMFAFTVKLVQRFPNPEEMTGHLSFDFVASEEHISFDGFEKNIYTIECNPRAHTAVVLFAQQDAEAMVNAYLSAVDMSPKEKTMGLVEGNGVHASPRAAPVISPTNTRPRYWIGHDLVSLLIHPIILWWIGLVDFSQVTSEIRDFACHIITWKEGTFEIWDPLPALFLYHIYWPSVVLTAWWQGKRWSRINVSTTKMFAC